MLKHKRIREKGKIKMSALFREFKEGDAAVLIYDPSTRPFSKRFHGKICTIMKKQGNAYVVSFFEGNREKKLVLKTIYLKKLSS